MIVQRNDVSRKRFMENVTLLWTLKEIVELPRENVLRDQDESWRQLSVQQEKTLASVFAFLSATHDDTCKITAVCIEENRHDGSLTIRTASNTGDCSYLRSGFEDMARILEKAHCRGRAKSYYLTVPLAEIYNTVNTKEEDRLILLHCITRVDQQKILCRLRSRHAAMTRRTSNKRSPFIHLREAVQDPSVRGTGASARTDLRKLRVKARELELMFIEFESKQDAGATNPVSLEALSQILQAAHAFMSIWAARLIAALRSSPKLDPSTKKYLPTAMAKLARYFEASRYLVSIARNRKLSVFSNIKAESYQLDLPNQPLFQGPFPSLEQSGKNVIDSTMPARRRKMNATVESFFGKSYQDKARKFQARVSAASNVWKVHAEIQLLVYHELNPEQPKPRVIASSKDACYLCNLFVNLHGQFHVPKTHGRIYDRWVFPDWVEFPPTSRERMSLALEQLNGIVETTIAATVRSQRMSHNHPNESTLFSIKSCSSSTVNAVQVPTPLDTPLASGVAHALEMPPADLLQGGSYVSTSNHSVSTKERQLISNPNKMPGANAQIGVDASRFVPSTSLLAEAKTAEMINRIPENSSSDPKTPVSEGQCRSSQFSRASAVTVSTAATPRGIREPSSSASSEELVLSSSYRDDSDCCSIDHNGLPPFVTNPHDSCFPGPKLTKPGETFTRLLTPATDEVYLQTGNLHLTLGREQVSFPGMQHPPDCTVTVNWLGGQEQSRLVASNHLQHIIDARAIPEGEAVTVTVSHVFPPEDGILLSCGPDLLVSIKYDCSVPSK